jgi:hypothetical protein
VSSATSQLFLREDPQFRNTLKVPDIARKKCEIVLERSYGNEKIEVWDETAPAAKERANVSKTPGNICRDGKYRISSKEYSITPDVFLRDRVYVCTFQNFAQSDNTYCQAIDT